MIDKILKQINEHARKFNYTLTEDEKEELVLLYEMNHEIYDASILSLHIEKYMERKSTYRDSEWMNKRRQSVVARSVSPLDFQLSTFEKTEATARFLFAALGSDIPFSLLTAEQKNKLVASMYPIVVEKGTVLIQQGDVGAEMYVIQEGEFDVSVDGHFTNKLLPGSKFGELALLHEIPRTATVRAVRRSCVWAAEQTSFSCIRIRDQLYRREIIRNSLRTLNYVPGDLEKNAFIERAVRSAVFKIFFAGKTIPVEHGDLLVVLKDTRITSPGTTEQQVVLKGGIIRESFTATTDVECAIISPKSIGGSCVL